MFLVSPIQCGDWVVGLSSIIIWNLNHFDDVYLDLILSGVDRKKEVERKRLVE